LRGHVYLISHLSVLYLHSVMTADQLSDVEIFLDL